jgi:putative PIN family toxin of toxin-antitoxin system
MQYHVVNVRSSFVLDTDVLVAALRCRFGASRPLLLGAFDYRFELLLSVPLMLDYQAVLTQPEHLAACGLASQEVEKLLDDLASVATQVRLAFRWRPRLADPNDDMVLETAVNGNANAIVTFNLRDFEETSRSGARTVPTARQLSNCAVILPGAALRKFRRPNP